MNDDIEWVSDESDYVSDDEVASLQPEIPSILWKVIQKSAEQDFDGNVLNAYISFVLMCRNIKRDVDHQKIMSPVQRYQEGPDAICFKEALLEHLIQYKVEGLDKSEEDE